MDENSFGAVKGLRMGLVRLGLTTSGSFFFLNAPPWVAGLDNDWVPAI